MTKNEMIAATAEKLNCEYTKKQIAEIIDAHIEAMKDVVCKEGCLHMAGFGTFKAKTRAARKGHNPQTGEDIDIPEKNVVTFKASKEWNATL